MLNIESALNQDRLIQGADSNADTSLVKRVIGLLGDTVEIKQGMVYVENQRLRESYIAARFGSLEPESPEPAQD